MVVLTGCSVYGFFHDNDLSIIDAYYGIATLVISVVTLASWRPLTPTGVALGAVTAVWSLLFGMQLGGRWFRDLRHHGGDVRYKMTEDVLRLDKVAARSTFLYRLSLYASVALLQVVLIAVLNLPLQFAIMTTEPRSIPIAWIGVAVAAFGGLVEVSSNRQLDKFKATSRPGQTLMSGWWYWSRHPNYFGNTTVYIGCFIAAVADPTLWWTIVSPLCAFLVLRFVLGVRLTDGMMMEKRKDNPEYLRYVRETPSYIPLPPPLRQWWQSAAAAVDRR